MSEATAATEHFDQSRADAFEEHMVDVLNHGALSLMISIGHRTGLFDTMAEIESANSTEIASCAGLNERYVREWLGAMTVGRFVEHDPDRGTFRLPPEHAAMLTRASPKDNLAVFAQYVPLLGTVEDDIVDCFRNGGGVPYERFGRFHEIMVEDSGQSVVPALREHILPLVPGLAERLESGIRVLDAGCGSGRAVNALAEQFPRSRFTGYDLSGEAVERAQREGGERGNRNVTFAVRDLGTFDTDAEAGQFELITTFDSVHDQVKPMALLRGIRRSLTDDGVYLAQDIKGSSHVHGDLDHPIGPLLYTLSCMHCMTVSLSGGGEGLGAMWGREKAEQYFRDAGFGRIEVHELEHDIQNYWYVCRP